MHGYVLNDPINAVDPWGLYTEVLVWQPVGWGTSSFSHVSANINGTSYSYGPSGMSVEPIDAFMKRNSFREGKGLELNLSPCEEEKLAKHLNEYNYPYLWPIIQCISPIQSGLINKLGYEINTSLTPISLIDSLTDAGLVN